MGAAVFWAPIPLLVLLLAVDGASEVPVEPELVEVDVTRVVALPLVVAEPEALALGAAEVAEAEAVAPDVVAAPVPEPEALPLAPPAPTAP